jgi:hypothetical protein
MLIHMLGSGCSTTYALGLKSVGTGIIVLKSRIHVPL